MLNFSDFIIDYRCCMVHGG